MKRSNTEDGMRNAGRLQKAPGDGPAANRGSVLIVVLWVVFGLVALGAVSLRYPEAPGLVVVGGYLAVLVLLLATDLDQRLLPDVLTLPLAGIDVRFAQVSAVTLAAAGRAGLDGHLALRDES